MKAAKATKKAMPKAAKKAVKGTPSNSIVKFTKTRAAVAKIRLASIRDDFAQMVDGVEYCFAKNMKPVAVRCARALAAMSIGLNRSITPAVAIGILDAILEDGAQDEAFRAVDDMTKSRNAICKFDVGCVYRKGGTCYTIWGSGCGGPSGISLPWMATQ